MFYKKDKMFDIFKIRYKDKNLPEEVLTQLADYTHRKHFAIKHKEIKNIFFIGQYDSEDKAQEKIIEAKNESFIYDHCIAEVDSTYYLFRYWLKPFD
ncbi:MAG: hypothetical protein ACQESJ_10760 [Bacteroidota bacterium]